MYMGVCICACVDASVEVNRACVPRSTAAGNRPVLVCMCKNVCLAVLLLATGQHCCACVRVCD
jgi:hypothetical protein